MPICLIAGSGDVNGDGNVNKSYVELIIDFIMGKASVAKEAVDFNEDGNVNAVDMVMGKSIKKIFLLSSISSWDVFLRALT